jgi:hypothetical protein
MPNPLWPLRRQGPNRWLRWGASFVCLAQALVIVVVVVKACLETEGGCHWYSFVRTAFSSHKFRSLPVDKASSEIIVLPPLKDFDASRFYQVHVHQLLVVYFKVVIVTVVTPAVFFSVPFTMNAQCVVFQCSQAA